MSKDKKKKKYYLADSDKLQKKLESIGTGVYFKPKEGKNIIRILPPWNDEGLWYCEATLHYGLKGDKGKERGYPCLKMFNKECPICDKKDELMKGDGEDKKIAGRIGPRTKYYANILDRKTGKVMIWGFSAKTLGILLQYCQDPDYGEISHPEEGYDVIIERTGTTMIDTRYNIRVRPKQSEVGVEGWEDELHKLDEEVVEEMDAEELEQIVEENLGKSDSDDDEEDEDKPKKKKKSKKDEEDEEEDEEDEEEEEESPKKKRGKKAKKEEDEEEEDEDEDEEEVKPKKGKKGKKKSSKDDDEDEDDDDEEDDD